MRISELPVPASCEGAFFGMASEMQIDDGRTQGEAAKLSSTDNSTLLHPRRPRRRATLLLGIVYCMCMGSFVIAAPLLAIHAAMAPAPSSESALDRVLSSKRLRVGCPCDYEPFAAPYERSGARCAAEGSDIDAARSLAHSLDAQVELVKVEWRSLLDKRAAYDIGVGGISVTLMRQRHAFFSLPYVSDAKVLVAACGDPLLHAVDDGGIGALRQLPDLSIAVNPGGTNEQVARELGCRVELVRANGEQFKWVLEDAANATLTDSFEAAVWSHRYQNRLCVSNQPLTEQVAKAFLLPRGDVAWQQYVNAWLTQWVASGGANASLQRWIDSFALRSGGS